MSGVLSLSEAVVASITNGIGFGFIAFCVLRIVAGRARTVPVAMYGVAAVFAFYYLMPALGLL